MGIWHLVAVETTRPHVSYAVVGFALLLFGTTSLILKERLYIGEATVATIYGLIVGPHCLNWFSPTTWGNTDYITMELSRLVLIVQIFAVAVELPKKYMLRHWWSVGMLLVPVMTFGWVVSSVFIWKLIPSLRWIEALCIAGCVTATDPVLASAVVGKGKFARRVPGHLRNLLSAESACNDGMAYPFVMLAVSVLREEHKPGPIARDFIAVVVLYGCTLGILIGTVIGYGSRHLIKFAERHKMIDRESFLVYYFCVAIFCMGVGTLTGVDDLLVAFAAGAAFSWDGWFAKQTENAHVSNVIDVLLNTAFFVYFGAVVPWPKFNDFELGIRAWKLVIIAIILLAVRRLPIMLALKPIIPDIKTWREAVFCGHFGPIGVGGLFMALLARAMLINDSETPPATLPSRDSPHYFVVQCIWPVTCFLVIASIIVHGSSVAVFTLGKHLNNMAITMTYTTGGNNPSWMSRLPSRFNDESGNPLRLEKIDTEMPIGRRLRKRSKKGPKRRPSSSRDRNEAPQSTSINLGGPHRGTRDHAEHTLHEAAHRLGESTGLRDEDHDKNVPKISVELVIDRGDEGVFTQNGMIPAHFLIGKKPHDFKAYREGGKVMVEDTDGNVIHTYDIGEESDHINGLPQLRVHAEALDENSVIIMPPSAKKSESPEDSEVSESFASTSTTLPGDHRGRHHAAAPSSGRLPRAASIVHVPQPSGRHARIYAYQTDDGVVLENEEGDVIRRYRFVERGAAPDTSNRRKKHGVMGWISTHLPWQESHDDHIHRNASVGNSSSFGGGSSPDEKYDDLEHSPNDMLVPVDNDESSRIGHLNERDEENVREQLENLFRTGQLSRQPTMRTLHAPPSPPRDEIITNADDHSPSSEEEEEEEEDDDARGYSGTNADDDDEEPETEVERARRLAALGIISSEDHEDEMEHSYHHKGIPEPEPAATRSSGRGHHQQQPSNAMSEDEPRITFQLPKRPT